MQRKRAAGTAQGFVKRIAPVLLVIPLLLLGAAAGADDEDDDDEQRISELSTQASWVEAGFIYNDVDGNSPFAYGNYRGLTEDKFYGLGNIDIFRRAPWDGDSSQYFRVRGLNLGLSSRSVDAEYGHQGLFEVRFLYDELPVYKTETAQTFFLGVGSTNLKIPDPGTWNAGTIASAPGPFQDSINDNLRMIDVDWLRRKYGGGVSLVLPSKLDFDTDYLYEKKTGNRLMGAVMGQNGGDPRSVIVPEPIEYQTQQIKSALVYGGEKLQLGLEYYGSKFDNDNDSLKWQVPYLGTSWDPSAGFCVDPEAGGYCGTGRKGQMPDNWFHQIVASGGYNLPHRTRVTLSTAFSWMLQNELYLPYTVNQNLAVPISLPRNGLDGKIFTSIVDFGVASRPIEKLRLDLGYRFEDRNNESSRDTYNYVTSDAQDQGAADSSLSRNNLPYSLRRHLVSLDAGYELPLRTELTLGYEWEQTERDYQERSKVWENRLSTLLTSRPLSFLQTRFNYEHIWRDGSQYDGANPFIAGHTSTFIDDEYDDLTQVGEECEGLTFNQCIWENHPLLRKSYLADMNRDAIGMITTVVPHEDITLSVNVNWRHDDYDDSDLGLTDYEMVTPGIDASYAPFDFLSLYAFYNYQWSRYEQNGWSFAGNARIAQATDPNYRWSSQEEVNTHTAGAGFNIDVISNWLSFGVDYVFARSTGEIDVQRGSALTGFFPFPDTLSRQNNVSVYTEYRFTKNFSTRLAYLYQDLDTDDWALDNITPTSIACGGFSQACVIGAGQKSPDYSANAIAWSVTYKFW